MQPGAALSCKTTCQGCDHTNIITSTAALSQHTQLSLCVEKKYFTWGVHPPMENTMTGQITGSMQCILPCTACLLQAHNKPSPHTPALTSSVHSNSHTNLHPPLGCNKACTAHSNSFATLPHPLNASCNPSAPSQPAAHYRCCLPAYVVW